MHLKTMREKYFLHLQQYFYFSQNTLISSFSNVLNLDLSNFVYSGLKLKIFLGHNV